MTLSAAKAWAMKHQTGLVFSCSMFFYLMIGCIFYYFNMGWNVIETIYFTIVMSTTVGYGDFVPDNDGGKIFTIFYAIGGLLFFTTLLSMRIEIAQIRQKNMSVQEEVLNQLKLWREHSSPKRRNASSDPHDLTWWGLIKAIMPMTMILFVLLLVGILVATLKLEFSFVDALYWAMITALGIGFGDFVPSRYDDGAKCNSCVWFGVLYILALVWFASGVLESVSVYRETRKETQKLTQSLRMDMTTALLVAMDTNNDNKVSRIEWLTAMLVANGLCKYSVIDQILCKFDELAQTNDGEEAHITLQQVAQMSSDPEIIEHAQTLERIPHMADGIAAAAGVGATLAGTGAGAGAGARGGAGAAGTPLSSSSSSSSLSFAPEEVMPKAAAKSAAAAAAAKLRQYATGKGSNGAGGGGGAANPEHGRHLLQELRQHVIVNTIKHIEEALTRTRMNTMSTIREGMTSVRERLGTIGGGAGGNRSRRATGETHHDGAAEAGVDSAEKGYAAGSGNPTTTAPTNTTTTTAAAVIGAAAANTAAAAAGDATAARIVQNMGEGKRMAWESDDNNNSNNNNDNNNNGNNNSVVRIRESEFSIDPVVAVKEEGALEDTVVPSADDDNEN